jgi:hypothetical protein
VTGLSKEGVRDFTDFLHSAMGLDSAKLVVVEELLHYPTIDREVLN